MNAQNLKPAPGQSLAARLQPAILGTGLGPFLALGLVVLFFVIADRLQPGEDTFLTQRNLRAILAQSSIVAVAALGMTLIILSGGIDLSAGNTVALSATMLAFCLKADLPPALAVLLGIGTGCLAGFINGVLISSLRMVPFIITLGTMTIYLGIGKLIAKETTIRPNIHTQVPVWLKDMLSMRPEASWFGLPSGVWLTFALAILLAAILKYTVFGRYVYAIGSNESTARLCGISVHWNKIALYTLAGLFIGVAGMYQFSRLVTGNPTSGDVLLLRIIAPVVIGGGSLNGGRGSVLGTLAGVATLEVIGSGCTQLGLNQPIQEIILGVIIIAAVAVDQFRQQRLAR